jgi:hypothetical protein
VLPNGYGVMRPLLADIRASALAAPPPSAPTVASVITGSSSSSSSHNNNGADQSATVASAAPSPATTISHSRPLRLSGIGLDGLNYVPGLLMGQSAGHGRALPAAILTQLLAYEAGFTPNKPDIEATK